MKPIHIVADDNAFAESVLFPGDPLRAKYIADNFLDDAQLVNSVRNMLGYTGYYKGKRVSVIGSGMGIPSAGIYSYELYKFYNVKNLIRIGTAGAFNPSAKVRDIVLGKDAYSHSNFSLSVKGRSEKLVSGSEELNNAILKKAADLNIDLKYGTLYTSEVFDVYHNIDLLKESITECSPIASEMEAHAIYHIADLLNLNAACLVSISDSKFESGVDLTSDERQNTLNEMIVLALETVLDL